MHRIGRRRRPAPKRNIAELQRGVRYTAYPEPGYFRLKLVRGGPWVPALIWRPCPMIFTDNHLELTPAPEEWCCPTERPRLLRARIGDTEADPCEVWERGMRTNAVDYHWRMGVRTWAKKEAPGQPEARPRRKVDLSRQPSLF